MINEGNISKLNTHWKYIPLKNVFQNTILDKCRLLCDFLHQCSNYKEKSAMIFIFSILLYKCKFGYCLKCIYIRVLFMCYMTILSLMFLMLYSCNFNLKLKPLNN